jgi:hypothetical protein
VLACVRWQTGRSGARGPGGSMTIPDDAGTVLTAIRLGWSIAEVRGRNRPDAPPGARARLPGQPGHALPLRVEQTPAELRIAARLHRPRRRRYHDRPPPMPSVPDAGLPLVPSKYSRQNAQLVRMARERGITPVTPN